LTSCYVLEISPQKHLPLLIDEVIRLYQNPFPEIKNTKNIVLEVIFNEEENYQKTLAKGKIRIRDYLKKNKITKIGDKEKEYFWTYFGIPSKLVDQLI
jgi:alanyl-tRNA synthetase